MRDKRKSKKNTGSPDKIPPESVGRLDDDTIVRAFLKSERDETPPERPWWAQWFPWLSDRRDCT